MGGVHCPSHMGSGGQHVRRLKKEGKPKKCARPRSLPDECAFRCATISRGASCVVGAAHDQRPSQKKEKKVSKNQSSTFPPDLHLSFARACHNPFRNSSALKATKQLSSLIVQWEMRFWCVAKKPISLASYVAKIENIEAADSSRRNRSNNNNVKFQNRLHTLFTILHYCDSGD